MGWILDLLGSSTIGTIVGGALSIFKSKEERLARKQELDHEERMVEVTTNANLALADKNIEAAKVQGQLVVDKTELQAFVESQKTLAISTGSKVIDGIRGLMRPLITSYLMVLSTVLAIKIHTMIGGLESLDAKQIYELYNLIILQVVSLTSTAIGWWFASRPTGILKEAK